jgi:hypothetical protein
MSITFLILQSQKVVQMETGPRELFSKLTLSTYTAMHVLPEVWHFNSPFIQRFTQLYKVDTSREQGRVIEKKIHSH